MEEEDYSIPKKIIEKPGFTMERIDKNKYLATFSIENNKVYLKKIINFNLMQILYEVNKDVFDDFKYKHVDDNCVESYFLIKHFFSDFGLPQKYSHTNVEKIEDLENNSVLFICKNSTTNILNIPNKGEMMNLDYMFLKCKFTNDHKIELVCHIFFREMDIPAFVEKMSGIIISKMFIKVKQFIENIAI
jgi:hypothetical protein